MQKEKLEILSRFRLGAQPLLCEPYGCGHINTTYLVVTERKLALLPLGAKTMTMECGVRFLTDYLDGDHYYAVRRGGKNLDRAHTQFKLVADTEQKWDEMQKIIAEEMKRRKKRCCT